MQYESEITQVLHVVLDTARFDGEQGCCRPFRTGVGTQFQSDGGQQRLGGKVLDTKTCSF